MKLIVNTVADTDPVNQETEVFRVEHDHGGDPEIFTIQKKLGPNVQLRYMRTLRQSGPLSAFIEIVETLMGARAMDLLTAYDELTSEDVAAIEAIIDRYAAGGNPLALARS